MNRCVNCNREHEKPSNFCSQECADNFIHKQMVIAIKAANEVIFGRANAQSK